MASEASLVLSNTLRSISDVKITELDKKRALYRLKKHHVLQQASSDSDQSLPHRLSVLLNLLRELALPTVNEDKVTNLLTFAEQSIYDPTILTGTLQDYETWIRNQLDFESRRLDYAKLYSAIITDHLRPRKASTTPPSQEPSLLDGSFEVLEKDRLQQLRLRFEDVVFNPIDTDEVEIDTYLQSFFEDEDGSRTLRDLRGYIDAQSYSIYHQVAPFNKGVLHWVIKGLLKIDLLNREKKNLLKAFQTDETVLNEICDVLNMRWADLDNWQWTEDSSGLDVEPRRVLNGKFRVFIDEPLLQSMLIYYIGTKFSITLKTAMKRYEWPHLSRFKPVPQVDMDRRQFYLGYNESAEGVNGMRNMASQEFLQTFFLNQLPDTVDQEIGAYDDEDDGVSQASPKSWTAIKQQLLRHLATDFMLRKHFDGDAAVVQSDLQWFGTSIPHSTIFAMLRFIGLPEPWIDFFRKYLEVPLNMSKTAGEIQEVRIRKRGIPMAQSTEKFLGELVLTFLDIAVKKGGNMLLYRLHDDLFLSGPTNDCVNAWLAVQKFVQVMGLDINEKKTGSVHFGGSKSVSSFLPNGAVSMDFLKLTTTKGWVIDQARVNTHVRQLRIQLDQCDSILSFIQTYNSCIGRFFGHTFGLPANCFGVQHVEAILETHARIQHEVFGEGGVAKTLRQRLNSLAQQVLGTDTNFNVCDSFIFAPLEFGGLAVINPFIPLMLAKPGLIKDPISQIEGYVHHEWARYKQARDAFEEQAPHVKRKRRTQIFGANDEAYNAVDVDKFMSFEEFTRHRYVLDRGFRSLYLELMEQPTDTEIQTTPEVRSELNMHGIGSLRRSSSRNCSLTNEKRYTIEMYSDELTRNFGGLEIVDGSLVPVGVMKAIMGEKATWQMVL